MTDQADLREQRDEPMPTVVERSAASPCVGICRIELDLCAGCGRTLQEIADWSGMDDISKQATLDRIASTAEIAVPFLTC